MQFLLLALCLGCAPSDREVVERVLLEGIGGGDLGVLETYVREDLIQHSATLATGRAGLLAQVRGPRRSVQIHRLLVDGDRVAAHSTYTAADGSQSAAFDVYRTEAGLLVEHWDAFQAMVPAGQSVHGRSLVDGPTAVTDEAQTEQNRARVADFFATIWLGGQFTRLGEFVGNDYVQHNPNIPDGLAGLLVFAAGLAQRGLIFGYTRSPLMLTDGNFALVGSEGYFGEKEKRPFAVFYDLFRIEEGRLVEHWDVVPTPAPDPARLPHKNGLF